MRYGVYCIYDIKSGWLSPTLDVNDEVAIRNFVYAVQHNDLFSAFHNDYKLYRISQFDTETGDFVNLSHVHLADAPASSPKSYSVTDETRCDDE